MKRLLFMVMACYALSASAQLHPSENFIHQKNDSIIYAKKITIRPDLYGRLQVRVDSRQVPIHQIKFISTQDGFFANIDKSSFIHPSNLSERVIEGKINIFREISNDFFNRNRYYRYTDSTSPSLNARMYYNKEFGDLKRVQYHNLLQDMSDHQESLDLLKGYRRSINTAKTLYISAGVSFIAGLVTFWNTGSNQVPTFGDNFGKGPNFGATYMLMGAGTGLAIGGLISHVTGIRKFQSAIDTYNR